MPKAIKVRDLTLCDAREPFSLVKLSMEGLQKILPLYRDAHYYVLEMWREEVAGDTGRTVGEEALERMRACDRELRGVSMLGVSSLVRTMLGDGTHPTMDLDEACRIAFENGLDLIRFADNDNDPELLKRTIRKVSELGGVPDAAICYLEDEEVEVVEEVETKKGFFARWFSKPEPKVEVPQKKYTDDYFVRLALELEKSGAKVITLADRSGILTPSRIFSLMPKLKIALKTPVDIYLPVTAQGVTLGSAVMSIIKGVDIIDTSIWGFGGIAGGPAIELVSIFCKKLGVQLDVDMKAVAEIRKAMAEIGERMEEAEATPDTNGYKPERKRIWSDEFEQLYDKMPREIDMEFERALSAAGINDEASLISSCRQIEAYFGFA